MRFEEHYDEQPILLMTIGIPGSGKSTWINQQKGFTVVSPDEIRRKLTGDISNQASNQDVFRRVENFVRSYLQRGKNVILDATNVNTELRRQFIDKMPKEIKLQAKIFEVDPEEAKRRIRKDVESGRERANVPDDVIDRMQTDFEKTLSVLEDEGFEIVQ